MPRSSGPVQVSRAEVSKDLPARIVPGQTTRTEILLLLGEPDGRADRDRWFAYSSRVGRGGMGWKLFVAVGMGYGSASSVSKLGDWETARRAIIHFDSAGVVSNVDFEEKNCTLENRNCPDAGGRDILAAEEEERAAAEHAVQLAGAGTVLAGYGLFMWVTYDAPDCRRLKLSRSDYTSGKKLLIAEHAILGEARVRGGMPTSGHYMYPMLRYEEIAELRPVERHFFHQWIPIRTRSGSCHYLELMRPAQGGLSPDQARTLIIAHLDPSGAPAASGAGNFVREPSNITQHKEEP